MNEKLAALKVYCLWAGIAEGKLCKKMDYPLFLELGIHLCEHHCPWCEIFNKNTYISRVLCTHDCPLGKVSPCYEYDSLYEEWRLFSKVTKEERAMLAGDIATIAWKEYKRLGG